MSKPRRYKRWPRPIVALQYMPYEWSDGDLPKGVVNNSDREIKVPGDLAVNTHRGWIALRSTDYILYDVNGLEYDVQLASEFDSQYDTRGESQWSDFVLNLLS